MRSRSFVFVAVGLIAAAALVLVWRNRTPKGLNDPRAARITKANYERIQDGMSAEEVTRLLGVPPGDYRSEPGFALVGPGYIPSSEKTRGGKLEVWHIPRYHVEVLFDRDGRVVGKYWHQEEAYR